MPAIDISRSLAIEGWMSSEELEWLAQQAQTHVAIAEVGCFIGRSTRALADHTSGIVYAIDPWDPKWLESVGDADPAAMTVALRHPTPLLEFVENTRDLPNVLIRVGTLPSVRFPIPPDMIFIDGDHRYRAVSNDIFASLRLLRPGCLLCGHDYEESHWPDVTDVVRSILGTPDGVCGSIWWVQL